MRRDPAKLPTVQVLWKVLRYEPSTGRLYWRARSPDMFNPRNPRRAAAMCASWNRQNADHPALNSPSGHGYLRGKLFGVDFMTHVVCWAMIHGRWPDLIIDHQNGDGYNNRPKNIRNVSPSDNSKNSKLPADNCSGVIGVSWNRTLGTWHAHITHRRKSINLGDYAAFEDACAARAAGEHRYGFHPNHGRAVPCAF